MKGIPGAIMVVAGAGLLTATSFTSTSAPDDVCWNVSFVVGLILCAFGLLAPADRASAEDATQPKRLEQFRFSIRDLLWLTLVVAILVAWWRDHQSLAPIARQIIPVVG
jgi:hypothetical protein